MTPRSLRRAALGLLPAALAAALLPPLPAHAAPTNGFEMPFPCGQTWTGTTRSRHSPSSNAVDWNRPYDQGDPVVAAAPGTVSVADTVDNSGYGRWVKIAHASSESTIYAHLQSLTVNVGQRVDQGAVIGYVGSTGNSSGAHLHFEERYGSTVLYPYFHRTRFVFGTPLASRNCVDVPLAGDLVLDGRADLAYFRRKDVARFVIQRPGMKPRRIKLGTSTDEPVLGDWDGNGRMNLGIRTPSTRTFTLKVGSSLRRVTYGRVKDLPVAGDWDGDGVWEVGVRRPAISTFLMRRADGTTRRVALGDRDDLPVTGDWDGDGDTDLGVYDQDTATFTLRTEDEYGLAWYASVVFGSPGDLPVAADWDDNGRTDLGTWSPSTAQFHKRRAPSATAAQRGVNDVRFGRPRP
jgi:hypothetical protein